MNDMAGYDRIRNEVLKLVCYADLYDYSPSIDEITADLPWRDITSAHVRSSIRNSENHSPVLISPDDFLFLKGRENLLPLGKERRENTQELLKKYGAHIRRIANLPYVRTVVLSGATAFGNSSQNDDIDLFLIVQPNRIWIVELYNLFVIRLWREKICRQPRTICSNYLVETVSLTLPERDFFTAHQIVHMKPIYDEGFWRYFIKANPWVREYFPSFELKTIYESRTPSIKRMLEILGDLTGLGVLNFILFAIRGKRLERKRRLGMVKGLYSYRRLKANDSRRGFIALQRLAKRVKDYLPENIENTDFRKNSEIRDFISIEEKAKIDKFLDFYISRNFENSPKSEILEIPWFDKNRNSQKLWKLRSRSFTRVKALIRELEPDSEGPILDLGAGNCWISRRLSDEGYRVASVDACIDENIGLKAGDIFERELDIRLERYRAMMDKLPFEDESLRGVVASGSFHYAEDPGKVLDEINRVLVPGGWAIIYDSPVFMRNSDGLAMVAANLVKYDSSNELDGIDYKPRWFIDLRDFLESSRSVGFDYQIIPTRDFIRRYSDRVKNILLSRRRWPEFPILLLRKGNAFENSRSDGILQKIRYFQYRLFTEGKLNPDRISTIQGIKLKIPPGVFHPLPYDSSRIFLSVLRSRHSNLEGKHVLDMGTGCGIHAIESAKLDASVSAVDINPEAVNASSENANLNGVGERVRCFESDLFENVGDEKFDLVLFNPPFYEGSPRDDAEKAWKDAGNTTLTRFLEELPSHLKEGGESLLILSSRMDIASFADACVNEGLKVSLILSKRVWDETYYVYSLTLKTK